MPRYKVIYESEENIYGVVSRSGDWIHYKGTLKIKSGGKQPISLDMVFVPPHPSMVDMPETHSIKTASITEAYAKMAKFLKKFGVEFRN